MKKFLILIFYLFINLCVFSRIVTFAITEWSPYTGKKLRNYGFYAEITVSAMKKMGYDVKLVFLPWQRALNMVRDGKYDGLLTVYYSDERIKYYAYTDAVATSTIVFFKNKNKKIPNIYKNFNDLKKYTFGVVRGYKNTEKFDKATYLIKEVANNSEENLKKLIFGRIDILVDSKETISYLLNKKYEKFKNSIVMIKPPLRILKVYNVFSKKVLDYERLVKDFNKGFESIKEDGTYKKILESSGIK